MKKFTTYAVVSAAALAMLAACGGGGGGESTPAVSTVANAFAAEAGVYKTICNIRSIYQGPNVPRKIESDIAILTITAPSGSDKATVSAQGLTYSGSDCVTASAKIEDFTIFGTAVQLAGSKVITGVSGAKPGTDKSGTVKLGEVTYSGITLSLGSFGNVTLPVPGTKAKFGYLIEGSKVYVLSGSPAADGLPTSFSSTVLIKQ